MAAKRVFRPNRFQVFECIIGSSPRCGSALLGNSTTGGGTLRTGGSGTGATDFTAGKFGGATGGSGTTADTGCTADSRRASSWLSFSLADCAAGRPATVSALVLLRLGEESLGSKAISV